MPLHGVTVERDGYMTMSSVTFDVYAGIHLPL